CASEKVTNRIRAPSKIVTDHPLRRISSLIGARAGELDDLCPFRDVLIQVLLEFGNAHYHGFGALLVPRLLYVRPADDLADLGVQPIHDLPGRSGRRHDPEPDGRFVALDPGFRYG